MKRIAIVFAASLVAVSGSVAAKDKTSHPVHVLSDIWPGAGTGPQRLETPLDAAGYQDGFDAMVAAYGPPTNGRGDFHVWDIPNQAPGLDQADHVSVTLGRQSDGRYVAILEDRAPSRSMAGPKPSPRADNAKRNASRKNPALLRGNASVVEDSPAE